MRTAIYARFSTDRQSESSTADQLRVCRQYAEAHGFTVTEEFIDEAISGAALGNRPGALRLMEAALAGKLDCLLIVELMRLARSQADLPKMIDRLTHRGVRIIGIQDGYDSSRVGHKMQAGLSGIMGEAFREMVKARTYSALEMRAKGNRPTGGRAYGFDSKHVQIPEQVAVVREAFARFAAGETMLAVVSDLNCRGVPSPGASWKREKRRRDGRWLVSGLHAILHNELYAGRMIWNRREFRKDPDTGKRICTERPRSEWVIHAVPALIDPATWQGCQARLSQTRTGARGPIRYLLSGLLECGECGSQFTVYGGKQHRYACSTFRHGGEHACSNHLSVPRTLAEELILSPIVNDLLSPDSVENMAVHMRAELRREQIRLATADISPSVELTRIETEIEQLEKMVQSGLLSAATAGPALEAARRTKESHVRVRGRSLAGAISHTTEELVRVYKEQAAVMRKILEGADVNAARETLRRLVGAVRLVAGPGHLIAHYQHGSFALMTGTGVDRMVAGAGFEGIYPPIALVRSRPAGRADKAGTAP